MNLLKQYKLFLALVMAGLAAILALFQNCSRSRFSTSVLSSANYCSGQNCPTASGTTPGTCVFNGKPYKTGEEIIAFKTSVVLPGENCETEKRVCEASGLWTGSFQAATCGNNSGGNSLLKPCLYNGVEIKSGRAIYAFVNHTVPKDQSCESSNNKKLIICVNGVWSSGAFSATCTQDQTACLFGNQLIKNGDYVDVYVNSSLPHGQDCRATTNIERRVCINGSLTGSSNHIACVNGPAPCRLGRNFYQHGATETVYKDSSVAFGQPCVSEVATCQNGQFVSPNNYKFPFCKQGQPKACQYQGSIFAHKEKIKFFATPTVGARETCSSIEVECFDGTLRNFSSNYPYLSCSRGCLVSDEARLVSYSHNETFSMYASLTAPKNCDAVNIKCENGFAAKIASHPYLSCLPNYVSTRPCSFNGHQVAHNQTVIAHGYDGNDCETEVRTCQDGFLSGRYTSAGYCPSQTSRPSNPPSDPCAGLSCPIDSSGNPTTPYWNGTSCGCQSTPSNPGTIYNCKRCDGTGYIGEDGSQCCVNRFE